MSIRQDKLKRKELKEAINFLQDLDTNSTVSGSDLIQKELNKLELKLCRKLIKLDSEPNKPRKRPSPTVAKTQE